MTQEEKQLLLIDLCTRLTYGPKVWYPNGSGAISTVKGIVDDICYFNENPKYGNFCRIDTVKPYLRPMSSMTDEEKEEYDDLRKKYYKNAKGAAIDLIDWLNKNMFDYRGLIPIGLALEAPERMYNV